MMSLSTVACLMIACFLVAAVSSGSTSYYSLLGISKQSTLKEVKAAYRKKAKETHPDKNPNANSEEAAEKFREIAEAYEVLSDSNARKEYDRSGVKQRDKSQGNNNNNRGNQRHQPFWDFFGRRNQQARHDPLQHHLYRRHDVRQQVHAAQRRVLTVTSLDHFKALTLEDSGIFDRYVLLAIYNSNLKDCEKMLNEYVMFPWPFAGFTREGGDTSMWWEETMQVLKIDLALGNNAGTESIKEMQEYFGVNSAQSCPSVVFFQRGKEIFDFEIWDKSNAQDMRSFVWDRLTMTVTFENKTPWVLKQFYLNGNRGITKDSISPGHGYKVNTFLSHAFMFVADHVSGQRLNNESAVLYYTSRIQDDHGVVEIHPRCFDLHTDCSRWKREGYCDKNSRAARQKPGTFSWVTENCYVSCETQCGTQLPSPQ